MARLINFAAGPATLPVAVLEKAQSQIVDWSGQGFSILEANHRGAEFTELFNNVQRRFRSIAQVPATHEVLYLLAPARAHFAAIPLNLSQPGQTADYCVTGLWSQLAAEEARKYVSVNVTNALVDENVKSNRAYLYTTDNETVQGVQLPDLPDNLGPPLVSDMTSSLLTRPIEIGQYGLIFAGVQKNIAPAGLSIVIVARDLLGRARIETPSVLDYTLQAEQGSLLNTMNVFSIYMIGLMLDWIEDQHGLAALAETGQAKAEKLYQYIDNSDFYQALVPVELRSKLNIIFQCRDPDLHPRFLEQAKRAGMIGLQGHRSVGGLRVSLYNAIGLAEVDHLLEFMTTFAKHT